MIEVKACPFRCGRRVVVEDGPDPELCVIRHELPECDPFEKAMARQGVACPEVAAVVAAGNDAGNKCPKSSPLTFETR